MQPWRWMHWMVPRNGMCLGMLAEVYQALDDSNRELSIRLERSAHEIPGFDELCRIATLHELLGDPQKAAGAYAQLEERFGPGLHIVQGLQRVAESGGDDAEWESAAIRLCQSDWDEAPVEVLIALSAALKQGGREDEADALWGAMTQKAPQDQALLRHALEHSRSPEGASWRRQLAELTDDAEDREALLRKNLEADDVSGRLHAVKALMKGNESDGPSNLYARSNIASNAGRALCLDAGPCSRFGYSGATDLARCCTVWARVRACRGGLRPVSIRRWSLTHQTKRHLPSVSSCSPFEAVGKRPMIPR